MGIALSINMLQTFGKRQAWERRILKGSTDFQGTGDQ